MIDYAAARRNMVDGQVKPNRVSDPALLEAMLAVPRERFVPKPSRGIAHVDDDLPVGHGRFLLAPMVFARLVQEAMIDADDVVLDIGCATGYSTAVLSRIAASVVGIEQIGDLATEATETLTELGIDNGAVIQADLTAGCPSQQPFTAIMMNGAVADVPPALFDQLADGGRLVAILADRAGGIGHATLYGKVGGVVSHRVLFDASAPLLPGFEPVPAFEF